MTKEPKLFGGIPWGASRRDVVAANPFKTFKCYDLPGGDGLPTMSRCGATFKMGDAEADGEFHFNEHALTSVDMGYSALQFDFIKSVLLERYGPPTSDNVVKTMTKAGVPYDDEVLVWEFPSVRIEAHRYGISVDRGVTYFQVRSWLDELARREQESKKKAKDAF